MLPFKLQSLSICPSTPTVKKGDSFAFPVQLADLVVADIGKFLRVNFGEADIAEND
ncbi:hypothetical protein [Sinorhizobium medicae]|uniref:hypothetical protein n=1 Tax=Sinorhizobium medicae TaxID=110321 RepID=UPI0030848CD4|nr:hypothetical protein U8C38_28440 [Sinorhizobium medicae]